MPKKSTMASLLTYKFDKKYDPLQQDYFHYSKSLKAQQAFDDYHKCISDVQIIVKQCESKLQVPCTKCPVHVIKTVRLDMASVGNLLENLPNLQVIHLLRNPISVALSRIKTKWSSGYAATKDIIQSAGIYCQVMAKDLKEGKKLAKLFPGSLMQVNFDDFIDDPVGIAKNIYHFLNMTLLTSIENYLKVETKQKHNIKNKVSLNSQKSRTIHDICQQQLKLLY
jgi:hypothetical protein